RNPWLHCSVWAGQIFDRPLPCRRRWLWSAACRQWTAKQIASGCRRWWRQRTDGVAGPGQALGRRAAMGLCSHADPVRGHWGHVRPGVTAAQRERTAEGLARTGLGERKERLSCTLLAGSHQCALTGRSGMREVVVRVAAWRAAEAGAPARLDLLVQTPERTYPVFIAGHGLQPQPGVEAGAVLGLMAAMRTGLPLRVEGALSETFLRGVGCYMQRFTAAFPEFKAVEVRP